MNTSTPFKWRHFEAEIIVLCVRWYLRSSLSYRDLEEMKRERGLEVDHTTIYRRVQHDAPELEKHGGPHLKACNDSWKVDETYIKVRKTWMYLYRAVDSDGNTLEFLLSPTRDAEATKRFFLKALPSTVGSVPHVHRVEEQVAEPTTRVNPATSAPRVINVDKNAAYRHPPLPTSKPVGHFPPLSNSGRSNTSIPSSSKITVLSNAWSSQGWASFPWKRQGEPVPGYEVMNMIRKGQVRGVSKGDISGQVSFIASLFGVAAYAEQEGEPSRPSILPGFFATQPLKGWRCDADGLALTLLDRLWLNGSKRMFRNWLTARSIGVQIIRYTSPHGEATLGLLHHGQIIDQVQFIGELRHLLRLRANELRAKIEESVRTGAATSSTASLLAPIDGETEVWAAGVTYKQSEEARKEESGTPDIYAKVYTAQRPELFFKATPRRVAGPDVPIVVRSDSAWDVPEPELVLAINAHAEIIGYTIGNDVSSRSIEGENPLYLPQAKVYASCCALGPSITPAWEVSDPYNLTIRLTIERNHQVYWEGETSTHELKRRFDELVRYLFLENDFPDGVFLCTGTALVPEKQFTLQPGDVVQIRIDQLGTLRNPVVRGKSNR